MCMSSSKHQITKEVNQQFARQISNVASTGHLLVMLRRQARLIRREPAYSHLEPAFQAKWLLLRPPDELSARDASYRQALCKLSPALATASDLARAFVQMVRERKREALDGWLNQACSSPIQELRRFALGLRKEYDAMHAALCEPWSTGQVEGQITRLKYLKRQMYGRAKIDLLRLRVLHPT
jgi:transposase